jgi:hypothetical protein
MAIVATGDGTSDPILTRMVAEDKVPWWKKPNLRIMYIYLFLCCMGKSILDLVSQRTALTPDRRS